MDEWQSQVKFCFVFCFKENPQENFHCSKNNPKSQSVQESTERQKIQRETYKESKNPQKGRRIREVNHLVLESEK